MMTKRKQDVLMQDCHSSSYGGLPQEEKAVHGEESTIHSLKRKPMSNVQCQS